MNPNDYRVDTLAAESARQSTARDWTNIGKAPCDGCPHERRCAQEVLTCNAFEAWSRSAYARYTGKETREPRLPRRNNVIGLVGVAAVPAAPPAPKPVVNNTYLSGRHGEVVRALRTAAAAGRRWPSLAALAKSHGVQNPVLAAWMRRRPDFARLCESVLTPAWRLHLHRRRNLARELPAQIRALPKRYTSRGTIAAAVGVRLQTFHRVWRRSAEVRAAVDEKLVDAELYAATPFRRAGVTARRAEASRRLLALQTRVKNKTALAAAVGVSFQQLNNWVRKDPVFAALVRERVAALIDRRVSDDALPTEMREPQ